jgi:hypothetical protein
VFRGGGTAGLKQIADARVAVDRALTITANGGVTWWDAELQRIRASVIRAEGGGDTAVRAALGRAVAIAEQQGSETFRRRAVADIGDAWQHCTSSVRSPRI